MIYGYILVLLIFSQSIDKILLINSNRSEYSCQKFSLQKYNESLGREIAKSELNGVRIKSFLRAKALFANSPDIQDWVVIQDINALIFVSLESNQVYHYPINLPNKNWVIKIKSENGIVLWSQTSNSLRMMKFPFDTTKPESILKIYEFKNDSKLVKLTKVNGKEYLMVVEVPKYVKVLRFYGNKLIVHQEYFVHSSFSQQSAIESPIIDFSNGILLMEDHSLLLQQKGKEVSLISSILESELRFRSNQTSLYR